MAAAPAANAQELGDLFEYRMTQPVTIRTNQSALVPILNARVNAERVSIWNRAPGSGRPLRAVWLTNTSALTLDGGTLSVIDANTFAGEGLVEPLKPSERRLVSYGSDLGVLVDARTDESSGRYTRVIARDGVVTAEEETRQRWIYRIRNEDSTPRTIVVEHPVRPGWTLGTDPAPAEMTAGTARYKVQVAARGEATLHLTERRMGETRYGINDVDDRVLMVFAQRGVQVEEIRGLLRPLMELRAEIATLSSELQRLAGVAATIDNDQSRMRENIKALGSSRQERQLVERYTRELGEQEDRLRQLRTEMTTVAANRDVKQTELALAMRALQFEVAAN